MLSCGLSVKVFFFMEFKPLPLIKPLEVAATGLLSLVLTASRALVRMKLLHYWFVFNQSPKVVWS